jgi:hypothetical protein
MLGAHNVTGASRNDGAIIATHPALEIPPIDCAPT